MLVKKFIQTHWKINKIHQLGHLSLCLSLCAFQNKINLFWVFKNLQFLITPSNYPLLESDVMFKHLGRPPSKDANKTNLLWTKYGFIMKILPGNSTREMAQVQIQGDVWWIHPTKALWFLKSCGRLREGKLQDSDTATGDTLFHLRVVYDHPLLQPELEAETEIEVDSSWQWLPRMCLLRVESHLPPSWETYQQVQASLGTVERSTGGRKNNSSLDPKDAVNMSFQ